MRELNARLNVHGLSDADAANLPVQLDATTIGRMEISTWRTDGGDLDILSDMPGAGGRRRRYEELTDSSQLVRSGRLSIRVAGLRDIIASKEWADRPKDHEALPELYRLDGNPDSRNDPASQP